MIYFDDALNLFNLRYEETNSFLTETQSWINDNDLSREHEHILKSNIILMQYNILESSFVELYSELYSYLSQYQVSLDSIDNDLSYKVFCMIKRLNSKQHESFKTRIKTTDNGSNPFSSNIFSLCFELNEETRKSLVNGNLDGRKIKDFLKDFGLDINEINQLDLSSLKSIKDERQRLAHGAASFMDVGREISWDGLKNNMEVIKELFTKSKEILTEFIQNLDQKSSENS